CLRWRPERVVKGIAHDTPVPGYRSQAVNLLRLWKAEAAESFDFDAFNTGDYYGAVDDGRKVRADGASGQRRQPCDQRRCSPAYAPSQADGARRFSSGDAGEVPE